MKRITLRTFPRLAALLCSFTIASGAMFASGIPSAIGLRQASAGESLIPAPSLDPLTATATSNPVAISGHAPPGTIEVRILVNGDLLQLITATDIESDGSFSSTAPLFDGANTLVAIAWNGVEESPPSAPATTEYTSNIPTNQSGTITTDVVWTPGNGAFYLTGNLAIHQDATLTLMPGVEVRVEPSNKRIDVHGTLVIHGQPGQQVQVRGWNPGNPGTPSTSSNMWAGIQVHATGYVESTHAVLQNAGWGGALYFLGGEGEIRHTKMEHGIYGAAIRAGSSPRFREGFAFANNGTAVHVQGNGLAGEDPKPSFRGGSFIATGNQKHFTLEAPFSEGGALTMDATGNWWGTADPTAISSRITDFSDVATLPVVDFGGYLGTEAGAPVFGGGSVPGGIVTHDTTIGPGSYELLGNLRVDDGATLTFLPGASIRVISTPQFNRKIDVYGRLVAIGTELQTIEFRSADEPATRSHWTGISVLGAGEIELDHVRVLHANTALRFLDGEGAIRNTSISQYSDGVRVGPRSSPTFSNVAITGGYRGVVISGDGVEENNPVPGFTGGQIHGNSQRNVTTENFGNGPAVRIDATSNWWGTSDVAVIAQGVTDNSDNPLLPTVDFGGYRQSPDGPPAHDGFFLSGPVDQDRILPAGNYQLLGNLRVAAGVTLTIEPGSKILAPYSSSASSAAIDVNGVLFARGTASLPIHFRSSSSVPAVNQWTGIRVSPTGFIDFDYVEVNSAHTAVAFNGGGGLVRNTTIKTNYYGTRVGPGSSPVFEDGFVFSQNSFGAVQVVGDGHAASDPRPIFRNGAIYGNGGSSTSGSNIQTNTFGAGGEIALDATNNWWGTVDPDEIHHRIGDRRDDAPGAPVRPLVNILGFKGSLGGERHLTVYDVAWTGAAKPRLDVSSTLSYTLNADAHVEIHISPDAGGRFLHELTSELLVAGRHFVKWHGKLGETPADDGVYRAVFELARSGENTWYDPPVPHSTSDSGMSVTGPLETYAPFANRFLRIPTAMESTVAMNLTVRNSPSGTILAYPMQNVPFPAGSSWIYWDGRNAQGSIVTDHDNRLYMSVDAVPMRPTAVIVSGGAPVITGTRQAPEIEVSTDPYVVSLTFGSQTDAQYRVDQDCYVTVKLLPPGIMDPSHPSAITIKPESLVVAREGDEPMNHSFAWDGLGEGSQNALVVAQEGIHTFAIVARSIHTQQTTTYRGVLHVYR